MAAVDNPAGESKQSREEWVDGFHKRFEFVLAHSELTKHELAYIYDVSLQTIYNWIKGRAPNQQMACVHAAFANDIMVEMIRKNILPVSQGMARNERKQVCKKILSTVLKLAANTHIKLLDAAEDFPSRAGEKTPRPGRIYIKSRDVIPEDNR